MADVTTDASHFNAAHASAVALNDPSLHWEREQLEVMEQECRRAGIQPPPRPGGNADTDQVNS